MVIFYNKEGKIEVAEHFITEDDLTTKMKEDYKELGLSYKGIDTKLVGSIHDYKVVLDINNNFKWLELKEGLNAYKN